MDRARIEAASEKLYGRLSVDGAAALGHRRSANLDAVRAIAALMVLAAHAYAYSATTPRAAANGIPVRALSTGISLFFVLSGFLIAGPFLRALLEGRRLPSLGRYGVRRGARILPGYWLALIASLLVVTGGQLQHWWQVPVHGLLMQNLVIGEPNKLLFVAWTLSAEAMFYIFVPLAAYACWWATGGRPISLNRLGAGVLAIGIASVAWVLATSYILTPHALAAHTVPTSLRLLRWILPNFLYAFCPGALIYLAETAEAQTRDGVWAFYRRARARPEALLVGALCMLVLALVMEDGGGQMYALHSVPLAVGGGLGVIAFLEDGARRRSVARILAPVGLVSYGIYLWHAVIRSGIEAHALSWVPGLGGGVFAWPFHVALLLGLTLPAALASWVLLERPLLRRTAAWDRRRRGGSLPEPRQDLEPVGAPVVA